MNLNIFINLIFGGVLIYIAYIYIKDYIRNKFINQGQYFYSLNGMSNDPYKPLIFKLYYIIEVYNGYVKYIYINQSGGIHYDSESVYEFMHYAKDFNNCITDKKLIKINRDAIVETKHKFTKYIHEHGL